MSNLRRLALAAVAVAFGAVMLGSWTRINGAGMTCPDWPLPARLRGRHGLGVVAPAARLGRRAAGARRDRAGLARAALAVRLPATVVIAALFVLQVLLGAATVRLANSPFSVVLHWGTAMAFIAALCAMAVFAGAGKRGPAVRGVRVDRAGRHSRRNGPVAFVTMCVGAYVSSSGAGLGVPLDSRAARETSWSIRRDSTCRCCTGSLRARRCSAPQLRFAIAWARARRRACAPRVTGGLALLFMQVLLGLLNVALRLPTDLREAHAVNAALLFLAFVVATIFAVLDARGFDAAAAAR